MQLSTKGRYAVMAMVDLATRETGDHPNTLSCLADIAARQQLSQAYLEQLFGKLRRAELVRAARGPGGGYRLARPSAEIAIADIVRCELGSGGCMLVPGSAALDGEKCQTHDLWVELGRRIALFLRSVTLADVVVGRVAGRAIGLQPSEVAQNAAAGGGSS
jgi:Rrf2 family iron-sulfur cluster assembly transcriptional regulator